MLNETEIEEFLRRFVRRTRELDESDEARLRQVIHDEARELWVKIAANLSTPSAYLGAVAERPIDQTNRLPTPPKPNEDPGDVFDPQRDISPG